MPLILDTELKDGGIPVISLKEYFTQNRVLVIPPWQREYSWSVAEDEQVDTLLKDLKKFLTDDAATEYLLGSIVLCTLPNEKSRPLLIDGQQRTLTLTLILMCCQKYLRTNNLIDGQSTQDTALDSMITSCINSNAFQQGELQPRVEMKRSDADQTLRELYNWSIVPGEFDKSVFKDMDRKNPTQKNLISSVEYIYSKLAGVSKINKDKSVTRKPGDWLQPHEIKAGILKLLQSVKLIQIQVDDRRESISVFDHINNRGMALNPADLVKNLMFESVQDSEFETISYNWNLMVESLMATKKARLQDPRYLLRSMSHIYYGAHESYDNLDVFWSKKFAQHKSNAHEGIAPIEFSKKLPDYAENLRMLVTRSTKFKFPLSDIYLAGELGSVQHYSVMLAGAHFTNADTYQTLARQVNLRTLLYMLAQERTQLFDAMIPDWAHAVRSANPSATKQEMKDIYIQAALPSESLFDDLRDRMAEWDYTNASQKKKIRSVLALLSVHLNNECKMDVRIEDAMRARKVVGESHPWEIEHILPQAKDKTGNFQSIGNLVLLSSADNNDASSNAPQLKKEHYDSCSLLLTRTLTGKLVPNTLQASKISDLLGTLKVDSKWDLEHWDEDSVTERTEFYFRYLKHLIQSVCK
jgi:hypothetical protein